MNDLLQLALDAHGGLDRWNNFKKVTIKMRVGGMLWPAKGQKDILSNSQIEIELHKQGGRYLNFEGRMGRETFFNPNRVAIYDNELLVEELLDPRNSFDGHVIETPWTKLQLVYFGTYAMWEYLTIPFSFTLPGFQCKETGSWHEGKETWRRLQVNFPDDFAYHSKEQVFYFNETGLLKRMDYSVDISGKIPAAQYVLDYKEFQGIQMPTRRLVYGRDENGHFIPEPLVVSIELTDVRFE